MQLHEDSLSAVIIIHMAMNSCQNDQNGCGVSKYVCEKVTYREGSTGGAGGTPPPPPPNVRPQYKGVPKSPLLSLFCNSVYWSHIIMSILDPVLPPP